VIDPNDLFDHQCLKLKINKAQPLSKQRYWLRAAGCVNRANFADMLQIAMGFPPPPV
jgi:hypothetical protein